jgi:hypothetical protein
MGRTMFVYRQLEWKGDELLFQALCVVTRYSKSKRNLEF